MAHFQCVPIDDAQVERLAELCKALAHPVRVQIVRLLMEKDSWVCGDIIKRMPLAQSTVSEHLRILKESGLIVREVHGKGSRYRIDPQTIRTLKTLVSQV